MVCVGDVEGKGLVVVEVVVVEVVLVLCVVV